MIKTYNEAVSFLEQHIPTPEKKHPGQLGLDRMKHLMDLLDNPQYKYPTIHVGGTSGKGSTATFIASILSTKYKVGLHTSPHLVKVNERIKIMQQCNNVTMKQWLNWNNNNIKDAEFIELVNKVIPVIKRMEITRFGPPSYFEIATAMAFLYFYQQKVDIAVIEVGMGGRYDATNVIYPLVSVITNIGLDHTEILGSTIEEIARDKAGIIKSSVSVISGVKQKSVVKIIESRIRNHESRASFINKDFSYELKRMDANGSVFEYFGKNRYKDLKIRLLGEHQMENAIIALRVIEVSGFRFQVLEDNIRKGLIGAYIPGRLEIINHKPLTIIDGAHNPDKMKALVKSMKSLFPKKKSTVVLAIKKEKNAREMLQLLITIADRIILTEYNLLGDMGIIKSYDSTHLQQIITEINRNMMINNINDPMKALNFAIAQAKEDSLILVTGSLYLVGEIKKNLEL